MPTTCVAYGCKNISNPKAGIGLHKIPFFNDDRGEAKKRRKKWVDFVKCKRAQWTDTQYSAVCSIHFKPEDFELRFPVGLKVKDAPTFLPKLKKDDLGCCVYPTIHHPSVAPQNITESDRSRRKTIKEALSEKYATAGPSSGGDVEDTALPQPQPEQRKRRGEELSSPDGRKRPRDETTTVETAAVSTVTATDNSEDVPELPEEVLGTVPIDRRECSNCAVLKNETRQLKNTIITLRELMKSKTKDLKKYQRKSTEMDSQDESNTVTDDVGCSEKDDSTELEMKDGGEPEEEEEEEEQEEDGEVCDSPYETEEEHTTETESEDDGEGTSSNHSERISMRGTNLRTEPKHIVFLSQLLLLFGFCHSCKTDNPTVDVHQVGTEAVVTTNCSNPQCPKPKKTWHSQPVIPGTKLPAGNFLLCMAILLAGGSASKVFTIFAHMGLGCISLNTFFKYQRSQLFPTIALYWKRYQEKMLDKVKAIKDGITIAGDGRHDSMGHCAKYGAYTIFCCTVPMILHFSLVQRNQAGSSPAMEFMGFKNCMQYLIGYGILLKAFVSDRHMSIAAYMRKSLPNIIHYFDIWHLKKKIRKALSKLSKENGCEALAEWIRPCENHLYWSATTTFSGNGKVIWAKFASFLSHIVNKHSNLTDALFNKCFHGVIQPRKWLKVGSVVYEKLCSTLTKSSLVKGIKQASPFAQTSCLEGFHSVLNQFAPKMIAYSYLGMYCRHILAAVHFNSNLQRDVRRRNADDVEQIKVTYPKFKNGEATVRNVRVSQNFDYVEEIFQTYLATTSEQMKIACENLKGMTPSPMNSMLEKESRAVAIQKKVDRSRKTVENVPPTTPVTEVEEREAASQRRTAPKGPKKCSVCRQPMKGHKNVKDCPKNAHKQA